MRIPFVNCFIIANHLRDGIFINDVILFNALSYNSDKCQSEGLQNYENFHLIRNIKGTNYAMQKPKGTQRNILTIMGTLNRINKNSFHDQIILIGVFRAI